MLFKAKRGRIKILALVIITIICCACDSGSGAKKELDKLQGDLNALLSQAKQQLEPHKEQVESYTKGELDKLFQLEYEVREIPLESEISELRTVLTELGAQRWDCFHVERDVRNLRIFCKRKPKSYLQYIPRAF